MVFHTTILDVRTYGIHENIVFCPNLRYFSQTDRVKVPRAVCWERTALLSCRLCRIIFDEVHDLCAPFSSSTKSVPDLCLFIYFETNAELKTCSEILASSPSQSFWYQTPVVGSSLLTCRLTITGRISLLDYKL